MYQRIKYLREDNDLKQKDVADYLNCSQVCYSNYELGKRDIPTEVLIKLAKLNVTIVFSHFLLEVLCFIYMINFELIFMYGKR